MKPRTIQQKIRRGRFAITDHALLESFKDGIDLQDILHVILSGKVIETYPSRMRILIYGKTSDKKIVHVVLDHSEEEPEIITVYKPDPNFWIKGKTRR